MRKMVRPPLARFFPRSLPRSGLVAAWLAAGLLAPAGCASSASSSGNNNASNDASSGSSGYDASQPGQGPSFGSGSGSPGDEVPLDSGGLDAGEAPDGDDAAGNDAAGDDAAGDDGGDAGDAGGDGSGGGGGEPDGGDGGIEGGGPPADGGLSGHTVCSQTWAFSAPQFQWSGSPYGKATAVDAKGNIFFATTLPNSSITIGGKAYAALGSSDGLLVKLDSSCNVAWVKRFGGALGAVYVTSVAVDGAGNPVVVGSFTGTVDFGKGLVGAGPGLQSGFVVKLASNGNASWQNVYEAILATTQIFDVAVDSSDNVAFVGTSTAPIDLGGGTLGSPGEAPAFVAKIDSNGGALYSVSGDSLGAATGSALVGVAAGASGGVWVSGLAAPPQDGGASYKKVAVTAALDASGNLLWEYGAGLSTDPDTWANSSLGVDANGEVVQLDDWGLTGTSSDGGPGFSSERTLHKRVTAGTTAWAGVPSQLNQAWFTSSAQWVRGGSSNVTVDGAGNSAAAGEFEGTLDVSPAPALSSAGSVDVAIAVLDSSGHLARAARWGGANADFASGVAFDASGDVVVGGWTIPAADLTSSAASATSFSLFVAKLGW